MPISEFQIFKVDLLAQHKEAIAQLYQLYSEEFPDLHDFWKGMADEKIKQAEALRGQLEKVKAGQGDLDRGRFQVEGIRASLNFIIGQMQAARQQVPAMKAALSQAANTEDAIIEKRCFEVFLNPPADFVASVKALQASARPLLDQLKNLLTK